MSIWDTVPMINITVTAGLSWSMGLLVHETIDRVMPQQDANNFSIELALLRNIWNVRVAEWYVSTHSAPCGGPPLFHSPYPRRRFRVWTRLL
jgi:hypothetical protein